MGKWQPTSKYYYQNVNHYVIIVIAQKIATLKPKITLQPAFTCSKFIIETLEQGVKYVQS